MQGEAERLIASSLQDVKRLERQLVYEQSTVKALRERMATMKSSLPPSSPSSKPSTPSEKTPQQRKFAEESLNRARMLYGAPTSLSISTGDAGMKASSSQGSSPSSSRPPSTRGRRPSITLLSPLDRSARRVVPSPDESLSGEVPPNEYVE